MPLTAVWGAGKRAAGNLLEGAFVGRRRWADSRLAFAGSTISPPESELSAVLLVAQLNTCCQRQGLESPRWYPGQHQPLR